MANTCSRRCWPNPCSNTSDRLSNTQFEEVFVVIRPDFAKFLRLRRNVGILKSTTIIQHRLIEVDT
jgi:hypothetical protein